jgi:transcription-repair coupling factor (superfamily II helicase)
LGIYRRIADIRSDEDAEDVIDELCDRFGDPPPAVNGLIKVALLRNRAAALGIVTVEYRMGAMRLYPTALDMRLASGLSEKFSIRFALSAGSKTSYGIAPRPKQKPLSLLEEFLDAAEAIVLEQK